MKTITMTATICAALAVGTFATITSSSASRALAGPEDLSQTNLSQTVMPIHEMMASANDLPVQSFDAF